MAGTEIYSYQLSQELLNGNKVFVFFRANDPTKDEYSLIYNNYEGLETCAINHTFRLCRTFKDTYKHETIDREFGQYLDRIKPDVVHIHHLLFLSHGLVNEVKKRKIPLVYTLHDYWLRCYRGQLLKKDFSICSGHSTRDCADCLEYLLCIRKYSLAVYAELRKRLPSFLLELLKKIYLRLARPKSSIGLEEFKESIEDVSSKVDLFLAPSHFIEKKFISWGFPANKILYCPNGIDDKDFFILKKNKSGVLRFGFVGTLLPMKGIHVLISAFKEVKYRNIELFIYGRLFPYAGFESFPQFFKKMIRKDSRIKFMGEFDNKAIGKILGDIDMLVVPSIWPENSPLIIQEAFLSKTPVLASRIGGIPELVDDGVNGLLFTPGDINDLKEKIEHILSHPDKLERFKEHIPAVKSIEDHAKEIEALYSDLLKRKSG
ncbi:MAG: hypothetical protein AMJ95_02470 [Omnitrophica WOR_2 bacterium SM23_72]|nr:MAG: hypothetical protein AMJ95_02470 [Omnitrophica WOR_2 bacterium SM23_72]